MFVSLVPFTKVSFWYMYLIHSHLGVTILVDRPASEPPPHINAQAGQGGHSPLLQILSGADRPTSSHPTKSTPTNIAPDMGPLEEETNLPGTLPKRPCQWKGNQTFCLPLRWSSPKKFKVHELGE